MVGHGRRLYFVPAGRPPKAAGVAITSYRCKWLHKGVKFTCGSWIEAFYLTTMLRTLWIGGFIFLSMQPPNTATAAHSSSANGWVKVLSGLSVKQRTTNAAFPCYSCNCKCSASVVLHWHKCYTSLPLPLPLFHQSRTFWPNRTVLILVPTNLEFLVKLLHKVHRESSQAPLAN